MHAPEVKQEALRLIAEGMNDCEIGRRLGVSRTTIRDWRAPRYVRRRFTRTCPRCWTTTARISFSAADYSELLGLYLGDGCVSRHARTHQLRLALDPKYPGIVEAAVSLLRRCFPENSVGQVRGSIGGFGGSCLYVYVYNRHLPCLLPQHAAGRKYERSISLEPWQMALLLTAPWGFLRGCINTDGSRFLNRTGRYEYPSYAFSNRSGDIVRLFSIVCHRLDLRPRVTHNQARDLWETRINRRECVALMDQQIGPKH